MAKLLSTESVRKTEGFAYWREAVCDAYVHLDCQCDRPDDFHGEILLNRLSRLSASFVSGSQQSVRRRRRDIARAGEESFLISLQMQKDGGVLQDGRQARLRPGDFALYSSVDRYNLELPDGFRQLVVQIPRNMLLSRMPDADLMTGIAVSGNSVMGRIIHDSAVRLVSAIDQSPAQIQHALQDTVVDLFVTGLASLRDARYELSRPEQQILLRADAEIRANLQDPDFDRSSLAAILGLSLRRLSELYRSDGRSISSEIRALRLDRIAADLKDSRYARHSIGEIAYRWGIPNQQSLTRMFKERFGKSPREYRSRG